MALREKGCVKTITASGGGTLTADANESYRVTEIACVPSSSDTYLTLTVGGRTINKIRVKGKSGNHLPFPCVKTAQIYEAITGGLFAALRARGFDLTIPVPTGYGLNVARYAETGNVALTFDVYDAGDVKADEPNGPEGKIQRYLHYGDNAAAVTASPVAVANSLMWTGGEQWPFDGVSVPHGVEYRLHGILACPVARGNNTANKGYTTFLTLWKEGNVLLDAEDQVGFPFLGTAVTTADANTYTPAGSVVGPLTAEYPYPPLWFSPPLPFLEGTTLGVKITVESAASGGIGANGLDVALALEKLRIT